MAVAKGHGFHPGEGQKAYGQKVGGECAGTRRERGLGAHQHPHELPFWDTSSPCSGLCRAIWGEAPSRRSGAVRLRDKEARVMGWSRGFRWLERSDAAGC